VVRRTQGGSYILRNTLDEELSHRVPVNQLRLVSMEGNLSPDSFEVEKILGHRGPANRREYLVKWKNFSSSHNTWEPAAQFDSLACIADYWRSQVPDLKLKETPAASSSSVSIKDAAGSATPAAGRPKKSPLILKQDQVGAPRTKHPPRNAGGGPVAVAPPRVATQALKQGVAETTRRVPRHPHSSRGSQPKRRRRV
jgi:hypothetical protein